jgi:hypothetical protein
VKRRGFMKSLFGVAVGGVIAKEIKAEPLKFEPVVREESLTYVDEFGTYSASFAPVVIRKF